MKWFRLNAASIGPVLICFAAIVLTTLLLSTIDQFVPTEHLMLCYLLPTVFVAIYFGSSAQESAGLNVVSRLIPRRSQLSLARPVPKHHFLDERRTLLQKNSRTAD